MEITNPCHRTLILVPNRGGCGEFFTAQKLRKLIEKIYPTATVIILAKVYSLFTRHRVISSNLRSSDFCWDYEKPETYEAILGQARIFNPGVVIQIPYQDGEMSLALRRVLPPRVPFVTLGEMEGVYPCLGFSPSHLGVFINSRLLAEALDSTLDHHQRLIEMIPLELKDSLTSLEKGFYTFSYAASEQTHIHFTKLIAYLAFHIQGKTKLSIVLVGNTRSISLSSFEGLREHLGIETICLKYGKTTFQHGAGGRYLTLLCFDTLPHDLFEQFLLATTSFPVGVTGDDSFIDALSCLQVVHREVLPHKVASHNAFNDLIAPHFPEVRSFYYDKKSPMDESHYPHQAAQIDRVLQNKSRWNEVVKNLLEQIDAEKTLGPVFRSLSSPKVFEKLAHHMNLVRGAHRFLESLDSLHPQYLELYRIIHAKDSLALVAKRLFFYMSQCTGDKLSIAFCLACGSGDLGLVQHYEKKIRSLSSDEQLYAYNYGFEVVIGLEDGMQELFAWYLRSDLIKHVVAKVRRNSFLYLAMDDQFAKLSLILMCYEYFDSSADMIMTVSEALIALIKDGFTNTYFHTFRALILWPGFTPAEKRIFLGKIIESYSHIPQLADELLKTEYRPFLSASQVTSLEITSRLSV